MPKKNSIITLQNVSESIEKLAGITASGVERVEGRLDKVEGRLDKVEGCLDRIEDRLDSIEHETAALKS